MSAGSWKSWGAVVQCSQRWQTDIRVICTVLTGETVRADNILRGRWGGVLKKKTAGGDLGRVFRKAAEKPVSTLTNSVSYSGGPKELQDQVGHWILLLW